MCEIKHGKPHLGRQLLEVKSITHVIVGADGLRVVIHHDGPVLQLHTHTHTDHCDSPSSSCAAATAENMSMHTRCCADRPRVSNSTNCINATTHTVISVITDSLSKSVMYRYTQLTIHDRISLIQVAHDSSLILQSQLPRQNLGCTLYISRSIPPYTFQYQKQYFYHKIFNIKTNGNPPTSYTVIDRPTSHMRILISALQTSISRMQDTVVTRIYYLFTAILFIDSRCKLLPA